MSFASLALAYACGFIGVSRNSCSVNCVNIGFIWFSFFSDNACKLLLTIYLCIKNFDSLGRKIRKLNTLPKRNFYLACPCEFSSQSIPKPNYGHCLFHFDPRKKMHAQIATMRKRLLRNAMVMYQPQSKIQIGPLYSERNESAI